jgi:hypothetical protein
MSGGVAAPFYSDDTIAATEGYSREYAAAGAFQALTLAFGVTIAGRKRHLSVLVRA